MWEVLLFVSQVPVAEGASTSLKGLMKEHIADFVHGTDGFGNTSQAAVEVCLHLLNTQGVEGSGCTA